MPSLEGGIKAVIKYYQTRLGLEEAKRQAALQELERRLREQQALIQLALMQRQLEQQQLLAPTTIERARLDLENEKLRSELIKQQLLEQQKKEQALNTLAQLPPITDPTQWLKAVENLPEEQKALIVGTPQYAQALQLAKEEQEKEQQQQTVATAVDAIAKEYGITNQDLINNAKQLALKGTTLDDIRELFSSVSGRQLQQQQLALEQQRLLQPQPMPSPIGKTVRPITITDTQRLVEIAAKDLAPLVKVMRAAKLPDQAFLREIVLTINKEVTSLIAKSGGSALDDDTIKEQLVNKIATKITTENPIWNQLMNTAVWKTLAPGGISPGDLRKLKKQGEQQLHTTIRNIIDTLLVAKSVNVITGESTLDDAAIQSLLAKLQNIPAAQVTP